MLEFDHIIFVRNPVSTHQERAERRLAELKLLMPEAELHIVETLPGGRAANRQLLQPYADELGLRTLLCIAAGDGTINLMVDALLRAPEFSETARCTPILPLWGGNGNDLASMLNGSARTSLRTILTNGKIVTIHPLSITQTAPRMKPDVRVAACYASFGASAFTAQMLGKRIRARRRIDLVPGARFVRELATVTWALTRAPLFQMTEAGKSRPVFESIFLNGPRFAKVGLVPLKITEAAFHHTTLEHKRIAAMFREITRLTSRKQTQTVRRTHATFSVRDTAWAQFDGETVRLEPGTMVEIGVADKPFYAVATSPKL